MWRRSPPRSFRPTTRPVRARPASCISSTARSRRSSSAQAAGFLAGLSDFRARYGSGSPTPLAARSPRGRAPTSTTTSRRSTRRRSSRACGTRPSSACCASPEYGGNRDGVGWRMIGFVDEHAFQPPFGYYDRDYPGFSSPRAAHGERPAVQRRGTRRFPRRLFRRRRRRCARARIIRRRTQRRRA